MLFKGVESVRIDVLEIIEDVHRARERREDRRRCNGQNNGLRIEQLSAEHEPGENEGVFWAIAWVSSMRPESQCSRPVLFPKWV